MGTTNRDSSLLTQKRRDKVLYAAYVATKDAIASGTSVRPEQTSPQLGQVVTNRREGACPCARETLRAAGDPSYINYDYVDPNVVTNQPGNTF